MPETLYDMLGIHPDAPAHVVQNAIIYSESDGKLSPSLIETVKTTLLDPIKRQKYNDSLSSFLLEEDATALTRQSTYEIPDSSSEPAPPLPEQAPKESPSINININTTQNNILSERETFGLFRIKSQFLSDNNQGMPVKITSFLSQRLLKSEKVLYTAETSYFSQFWLFVASLLFIHTFVISIILFLVGIFNVKATNLVITDIRILATNAWLPDSADNKQKNYVDLPINKIESIEAHQGLWSSIFEYGSIEIFSIYGNKTKIKRIKNPKQVKKDILNLLYYGE